MAHELPQLRAEHPAWHIWSSAQDHLYATRPGISVHLPGASVTVDAGTPEGLSQAIAATERDASRAADIKDRFAQGR